MTEIGHQEVTWDSIHQGWSLSRLLPQTLPCSTRNGDGVAVISENGLPTGNHDTSAATPSTQRNKGLDEVKLHICDTREGCCRVLHSVWAVTECGCEAALRLILSAYLQLRCSRMPTDHWPLTYAKDQCWGVQNQLCLYAVRYDGMKSTATDTCQGQSFHRPLA